MSFDDLDEFVVLTEVVREKYVCYLERQLQENVSAWASKSRNHHKPTAWAQISHTLDQLEDRAARGCMSARIYQRHMVKMIAMVRRNTQESRLANVLFENMQIQQNEAITDAESGDALNDCNHFADKSTQTEPQNINGNHDDNYTSYELWQKIDLFQARLGESQNLRDGGSHCGSRSKSPIAEQQMSEEEDDVVAQELAMLFGQEPTDLNEIFGIETSANVTDDPQVCALLKEINQAELPHQNKKHSPTPTPPPLQDQNHQMDDLHNSRWPCELYAQRRRLNACLIRILEEDWRIESSLREKFHQLFGEDSDDEFATHITSPSIDLVDEVLLASCILRIRPWIVRHLMTPLQDGLIGNRFLFKKLAKKLAHLIVLANPYASQNQVKETVEDLFCLKPRGIQSSYDLDNLPILSVDKNLEYDEIDL